MAYCTRHITTSGPCDAQDHRAIERAWEPNPITIRKVTVGLTIVPTPRKHWWRDPPAATGYAYAGNSAVPDVMALVLNGGVRTEDYPADAAFTLPAKGTLPAGEDHVDIHVSCSGGSSFSGWLIVGYTRKGMGTE